MAIHTVIAKQSWYNDNPSQLALSCHHKAKKRFVMHYIGSPWLENQMSASQPLDFLRSWYNMHISMAGNGRMAISTMTEL